MPTPNNFRSRPVYIDLDGNPSYHYTCGDVIRGIVRVHPTVRPSSVKLFLKGRCKMKIVVQKGQNSTTYKEKVELFSHGLKLFGSSQPGASYEIVNKGIAEDGNVELPFQFIFPSSVESNPTTRFPERRGFEHQPGHPLPPSLSASIRESSLSFSSNDQAVEYWIEAQVFGKAAHSVVQPLPFLPPVPFIDPTRFINTTPDRRYELFVTSRKLHPDYNPDEKIFRRFKNALTSNSEKAPWAKWRIKAYVPTTLLAGAQIPIKISFQHLKSSEELLDVPPLYIRRVQVKLICTSSARIPYSGFTGERDIDTSEIDEHLILHRSFPEQKMLLYDDLPFSDLGPTKLPESIIPNFQTFGLQWEYSIHVKLELECAKVSSKVVACHGPCRVVRGTIRPPPGEPPAQEVPPPFSEVSSSTEKVLSKEPSAVDTAIDAPESSTAGAENASKEPPPPYQG
ncbi:unnamed protein product [Periconia digitata]|uniref:Arrestin-like N-terminal domain-containing protein n=1 Tax=Periconia digitata TaxID=1303443 RepID=A0A9W4U4F2_9PLEO|nr:unnamed protein product [Periconia digitata]